MQSDACRVFVTATLLTGTKLDCKTVCLVWSEVENEERGWGRERTWLRLSWGETLKTSV